MEIAKVNRQDFQRALLEAGVKETKIGILKYVYSIELNNKNITITFNDSEV